MADVSTCSIVVTLTSSAVVVELSGELDMAGSADVRVALEQAAAAGRPVVQVRIDNLTFAARPGSVRSCPVQQQPTQLDPGSKSSTRDASCNARWRSTGSSTT